MQFRIKNEAKANFNFAASRFGKPLFIYLLPIFPLIILFQFDGTNLDNMVSLELNFFGLIMKWSSKIIVTNKYETEINFVDQGIKLPSFLVYWEHKHRIIRHGSGTVIIDEIYYKSPNMIIELLFYPVLFISFFIGLTFFKVIS